MMNIYVTVNIDDKAQTEYEIEFINKASIDGVVNKIVDDEAKEGRKVCSLVAVVSFI